MIVEQQWLPCWLSGKEYACNAGDVSLIPGLRRSPGEGNGNPLQFSPWEVPWTEKPGRLQSMVHKEWDTTWQLNNNETTGKNSEYNYRALGWECFHVKYGVNHTCCWFPSNHASFWWRKPKGHLISALRSTHVYLKGDFDLFCFLDFQKIQVRSEGWLRFGVGGIVLLQESWGIQDGGSVQCPPVMLASE